VLPSHLQKGINSKTALEFCGILWKTMAQSGMYICKQICKNESESQEAPIDYIRGCGLLHVECQLQSR
jgi:hypothetical protein